jgi:hypothetical protein
LKQILVDLLFNSIEFEIRIGAKNIQQPSLESENRVSLRVVAKRMVAKRIQPAERKETPEKPSGSTKA